MILQISKDRDPPDVPLPTPKIKKETKNPHGRKRKIQNRETRKSDVSQLRK